MAKLRDLADRAGTSAGTVSLALDDRAADARVSARPRAYDAAAALLDLIRHRVRSPVDRRPPTGQVLRESCRAQEQEEGE